MSIEDTDVRALYTGDASTVTFAIPFVFSAAAEVVVYERDETTTPATVSLLTQGSHYNVSGSNVVFVTAPAATDKILVIRSNALTQSSDFLSVGSFNPNNVETALDKLTKIAQEHDERIDRAPLIPKTKTLADLELPEPEANKVIGWNAAATGFENFDTDGIAAPIVNADVSSSAAIALSKLAAVTADRAVTSSSAGVLQAATLSAYALEQIQKRPSFFNISLSSATTTNAGDSIKISSANGTALSSINPAYVTMMSSTTPGQLVTFAVTADVTILISGAPFGFGGKGDITGQKFAVYAINDAGTLKWGVGLLSQITEVDASDDETAVASANSPIKVVVNSALSATSPCMMIGRFLADFDDTGGTIEDKWTLQSGIGDFVLGHEIIPIIENYETNTGQSIPNNSITIVDYEDKVFSSHGAVTVGASWAFTAPVSGVYRVMGAIEWGDGSWDAGEISFFQVHFSASSVRRLSLLEAAATVTSIHNHSGMCEVRLTKGETLNFRCLQQTGGSLALNGAANTNFATISYIDGSKF